jgi:glycosyltransferase involved in cell wall biosynthesis
MKATLLERPAGLIQITFCIPGDIALPTGGYRYDREVLARLAAHGVAARHLQLEGSYPTPSTHDLTRTKAQLAACPPRDILLIDGLALGAMQPAMIADLPHHVIALVHHPLGLEAGLSDEQATSLLLNEKAVLACVRHVIVTSPATKRILLNDFGLADRKITIAEPGTARAPRARGVGKPMQILAVGAVSTRKAYDQLVTALAALPDLDWRLTIAGSLTLQADTTAALRDTVDRSGVSERIVLTGALDDSHLAALYAKADLFAMSSLFEGYGMALTEALARGLPIVASSGGAAADTLPELAAIKVQPGDITGLTAALRRVMSDDAMRRRMGDAAWAAAALLPSWDDTAREIADVIKAL